MTFHAMAKRAKRQVDLLTEDEVARRLCLSRRTLQRYRKAGMGPAAVALGPRRIAYRLGDVSDWLDKRTAAPA